MHRIDHATAAPGELFTEGNPATATPATIVTHDWLNDVQENICGVVEAAGTTLAKGDYSQLSSAIRALIANDTLFLKSNSRTVAFTKAGSGTASIKAGTKVFVFDKVITFTSATAITMPTLTTGTDYSIWVSPAGAIQAVADPFNAPASPPVTNARKIGGFHYGAVAPGTTVAGGAFATAGTGMIWTQGAVDAIAGINAYSFWDLKFRCLGEQHGMALDPFTQSWAGVYFCSQDHITNGISRYNVNVASGTVLPRIPLAYGGNGTANYTAGTWYNFEEIAASHGMRLPLLREAMSAFYGVTENQSLGGAVETIPAAIRQPGYTSRVGVEQATGHIWTWCQDSAARWDGAGGWAWYNNNGGRGQQYSYGSEQAVRALAGGDRDFAAFSGSRASYWIDYPWDSNWSVGLRAFGDLLILE